MSYNLKTPEDVLRAIKDDKIQMIDLRFTDLSGLWQHCSVPPSVFGLESFEDGVGYSGSSIRGFQEIQESDMLAIPDPASAFLDPFTEMPVLVLICNIRDPVTGKSCTRDPRSIAQKAEAYLQTMQIGNTANFGLELEHFMFNEVRNDQSANHDYYEAAAAGANWSAARRVGPGQGHILRPKQGCPVPSADLLQDVRTQMVATLEQIGIKVGAPHHEVATGGQGGIDMRYATLTRMADNMMVYKYVVENVARQCGMTATFMPRLRFGDHGSGMRVHQSIWQGEQPLFAGDGYAGTSALMRHYIAGLLEHAPALLSICAPRANSYRRLVPGFEAPANPGYSQRNHPAACRSPTDSPNPKAKRVEFRCPDSSCNPYLAFAAMLMAGIDGFHNRLYNVDPGEPIDRYIDGLPSREPARIPSASGSLEESLDALEADHAFLLKGEVFTSDVIETYIGCKGAR